MTTQKVIILARKLLGGAMESSARLCLADAIKLADAGRFEDAKRRALRSIAYSVGTTHPQYLRAAR